jgi:hypothetical protein
MIDHNRYFVRGYCIHLRGRVMITNVSEKPAENIFRVDFYLED